MKNDKIRNFLNHFKLSGIKSPRVPVVRTNSDQSLAGHCPCADCCGSDGC